MPAIAVQSKEHGPVTVPLTSVSMVKRGTDGAAVFILANGQEMPTDDRYEKVSDHMVSMRVWGTVSTEAV